ncbi:hypothetical protein K6T82_04595 [Flavobacterium sp. 17A]|uniref:Collagen triple helix repeat-containing protein n=1 Tax=Flavobacterium potami TaxID=2872310 RepID=A0A9X1H8G1_9FLAO|nr:hypothetical protein [Flavobacterium potami]MBZ4034032.1 hypothetical protein [Flavobacterium potami]
MKNKLLPLIFILGSYYGYSQVSIGKQVPNASAQLEVFSSDKGVLIPNVELTSTVDSSTIKNGNVVSLLVFNTQTIADVVPGYYYWYNNKWNKFVVSGESNGIVAGNGEPGKKGEPGYPGENVTLYTDKSSGTVYVQNEDGTWTAINGKNGIDGKNGIAGDKGLPGDKGLDATVQMYIDYDTGIVYVRDPKNPEKWIPVSGLDGIAGATGAPGTAGSITTLDAIVKDPSGNIYAYVGDDKTVAGRDKDWADKSPNWVKINGLDGRDGKDGIVGGNGAPGDKGEVGYPGDNVAMYIDNTTGTVYVRDPKNPDKWIPLTGKNGIDGIAGATGAPGTAGSITTLDAIVKDPEGNIYAYVGDDKTVEGRDKEWADKSPNWVKINGLNGANGIAGATGAPGTAGSITTLDAIVKDPSGDIYAYVGDDKTVAGRDKEWADKSPNWVKINGLNGANGIAGATGAPGTAGSITTLDAIVKDPAGNIYAYVGDDKTVAGRDKEWADKSPSWVKINGLDGRDGKDGIVGGNGAPGNKGEAGYPGDNVAMYIDNTTGTVYVRDPKNPDKWIPLTGKNGIDGKNGIAGDKGLPGDKGLDASIEMYIDYETGTVYVRDPKDSTKWIPANKETVTSLKDVVTQKEDEQGQQYDVHTLTYTDENGTANPIDMSILVKGTETLTTLQYDPATGELNYKDEKGEVSNFKLTDLVGDAETLTKLEVNNNDGTLDYTDEGKNVHHLDLTDVVKEPWFAVASNKAAVSNTDDLYTQGWVGIGFDKKSDAPNEKLRVNGAITTVNSYYADYVFEDYFKGFSDIKSDYKFKKLEEVDAFIKKNKHLPGITPINELVKTKEGYSFNMSELSIQLLEKTEEMYLHIIEQNKINEAQSKEIEAKEQEIKELKKASEAMNLRLEKLEKLLAK